MTEFNRSNKRGLAGVSPERRREIAAMGGRAVKPQNRSFSRDQDLAKRCGAIGGHNTGVIRRKALYARRKAA